MDSKIIKGRDLMLFDSTGKSYAFATNHTLTLTAETTDVSSKDHGIWSGAEVSKFNWEISSENLYTTEGFEKMFDAWTTGNAVTVRFGLKCVAERNSTGTVVDGDFPHWTSNGAYYEGKAYITSLSANASNGDNATYSVTLTGNGQLKKSGEFPENDADAPSSSSPSPSPSDGH